MRSERLLGGLGGVVLLALVLAVGGVVLLAGPAPAGQVTGAPTVAPVVATGQGYPPPADASAQGYPAPGRVVVAPGRCAARLSALAPSDTPTIPYTFGEPEVLFYQSQSSIVGWDGSSLLYAYTADGGSTVVNSYDATTGQTTTIDTISDMLGVPALAMNQEVVAVEGISSNGRGLRQKGKQKNKPAKVAKQGRISGFQAHANPQNRNAYVLLDDSHTIGVADTSQPDLTITALPGITLPDARPASPQEWRKLAISPDGRWIMVYGELVTYLVDTQQQRTCQLALEEDTRVERSVMDTRWATSAVWSPDGRKAALVSVVGTTGATYSPIVQTLDIAAMTLTEMPISLAVIHEVEWAPDNRTIAVLGRESRENSKGALPLLDTISGFVQPTLPGVIFFPSIATREGGIVWPPDSTLLFVQCRVNDSSGTAHGGFCRLNVADN